MDLNLLMRALELITTEIDPDIQVSTVKAFLVVAMRGSCTQKDVEVELNATNATASRSISYWTDRKADRKPGLNFILRLEDPHDRRFKTLTLTKKGQAFLEKLRKV